MAELARRAKSSGAGDCDRPRPPPRPRPRPRPPRPRPRCGRFAPPVSPPSSRRAGATVAALESLSAPETSESSGRDGSYAPSRVTRRLLGTRLTGARGGSSGPDVDARHRTHRALAAAAAAGHAPRTIARRSDRCVCSVSLSISPGEFRGRPRRRAAPKNCARPADAPFRGDTTMEDLPTVRTSLDGGDVTPPGTPRSKEPPATPTTPSIGTRETRSADEFHGTPFTRGSARVGTRPRFERGRDPRSRTSVPVRSASLPMTEARRARPRRHPEPRLTAHPVFTSRASSSSVPSSSSSSSIGPASRRCDRRRQAAR